VARTLGQLRKKIQQAQHGGRPPDAELGLAQIAERIKAEGTMRAYEREFRAWAKREKRPLPNPDAEETFYKAMWRYGVLKDELE
jgi:hypothetical protein